MSEKREFAAVGISLEGDVLRLVRVVPDGYLARVTDLRQYKLSRDLEPAPITIGYDQAGPETLELTSLDGIDTLNDSGNSFPRVNPDANAATFHEIGELISQSRCRIGLAISEPHIYYHLMERVESASLDKLTRRVQSEVVHETSRALEPEAIGLLNLNNGHVLAAVREHELPLFADMERFKQYSRHRIPLFSFVESAETSLINLVVDRYDIQTDEITLILHVGDDRSRFIFLRGESIVHISQSIGITDGSPDAVSILYSRLMFEMDTIQLLRLDRVVLTGFAARTSFVRYFSENLPESIKVEEIDLEGLGEWVLVGHGSHELAHYAVALGTALQAINMRRKDLVKVDLTPAGIRERRNKLSLSKTGWALLSLLPLLTFGIIRQTTSMDQEVKRLQTEIVPARQSVATVAPLETEVEGLRNDLTAREKALMVVDSVRALESSYGLTMQRIMRATSKVGGLWLTDVTTADGGRISLKGYSLQRARILTLQEELAPATLKNVEAKEIREQTVYNFELEIISGRAVKNDL